MQVRLVLRSPGTGHSLENLFNRLLDELMKDERIEPHKVVLPHISTGLPAVWKNILFILKQAPAVNHITGDVHYVALATSRRHTLLTIPDCVLLNRTPKRSVRYMVFWLLWYYLPIRRAALVTAISEKTRRELYQYVGRLADKVIVVPCHYDPLFTYSPKAFNSDYPTLLHVGTAPHKNLGRLINAIAGLACRLLIVGKLSDIDEALLITHKIDYKNYINSSQNEIITLYKQCDIVLFVSLYEGFGLPIIEGQVIGRPVVTSAISPMNEVGGEGACYVDPTNEADIRRGILSVLNNQPYRDELIRLGLANAENYSINRITEKYVALYESLRSL